MASSWPSDGPLRHRRLSHRLSCGAAATVRAVPRTVSWIQGYGDRLRLAEVSSVDGLDDLLDRLTAEAITAKLPFNVGLAADGGTWISIVVGTAVATVQWTRADPWFCLICVSDLPETDDGLIAYAGNGQHCELPRHLWIDVPLARAAVRHYFLTSELTPLIQWQAL